MKIRSGKSFSGDKRRLLEFAGLTPEQIEKYLTEKEDCCDECKCDPCECKEEQEEVEVKECACGCKPDECKCSADCKKCSCNKKED